MLVLQRLEPEKDTLTALEAWELSGLADEGWSLRIVGDGSRAGGARGVGARARRTERRPSQAVVEDVASSSREPGCCWRLPLRSRSDLTVVEAMAAGVPVVAVAGGGHLETVGKLPSARCFQAETHRPQPPRCGRCWQTTPARPCRPTDESLPAHASLCRPTSSCSARSTPRCSRLSKAAAGRDRLGELVVCSLEAWDDVWRRNQFLTDELLRSDPELRVLFVEPPTDVLFDLSRGKRPVAPKLRCVGRPTEDCRLSVPLKLLPRRAGACGRSVPSAPGSSHGGASRLPPAAALGQRRHLCAADGGNGLARASTT